MFICQKLLKLTLIHGKCYGYCFSYCVWYTLFFALSKHWIRRKHYVPWKKVLRQPHNAPTLQASLSLRDKNIFLTLQVYFTRSIGHLKFIWKFASISCGIRQFKWILGLFHRSEWAIWRKTLSICRGKQELTRTRSLSPKLLPELAVGKTQAF